MILLYVVIVAHRGLVGVGTVFNMAGVGYSCELFSSLLMPMVKQNDTLSIRIPLLLAGILVLCFACSLFFTANIGVGPYDALGFMLSRFAKLPYKWVRVLTDVTVVSIGLLVSGGFTAIAHGDFASIQNIGIGTVITALSAKIFNVDYAQISKDVAFFMIKGAMRKNSLGAVPGNNTQLYSQAYSLTDK